MTIQIVQDSRLTEQIVKCYGYKDVYTIHPTKDALIQKIIDKDFDVLYLTKYQEDVFPYLDAMSNKVKVTKVVDTLIHKDGKVIGYNNMYYGMIHLLRNISVKNKEVLLLGNSPQAKTMNFFFKNKFASNVYTMDTTNRFEYIKTYAKHMDVKVLVNTTMIGQGLDCDSTPIDITRFDDLDFVLDIINDPVRTQLLVEADKRNIRTFNGISLDVYTVKALLELVKGENISIQTSKKVLKTILDSKLNLVLIGMPSAGKTTIGKQLKKKLEKDFVDMDHVIVKSTQMKIPEIFSKSKEAGFRKIESIISHDLGMKHGMIIGTGGGTIKYEYNMDCLKRNGIIVFIDRDLHLLISHDPNRPLSSSKEAIQKLYEERYPLYRKYGDIHIRNNNNFKDVILDIVKEYYSMILKNIR